MAKRKTSKVEPVECTVEWTGPTGVLKSFVGDCPYCYIKLHLQPVPASRPRVTRWGTYYLKTYQHWMDVAMASVPEALFQFPGQVKVHMTLGIQRARTSKLLRPIGDIDNYEKGIYDILTKKGYWLDDVEIVKHTVQKQFTQNGGYVSLEIEVA